MTVKFKKAEAAALAASIMLGFGSVGAAAANNSKAGKKTDELSSAMSKLNNVKLKNKTVKWLAFYDLNPTAEGAVKSKDVELFEKKYGGKIEWVPTTWDCRYDDLSTHILGGTGIDIYPGDDNNLPKGIISGMFQPVDKYINLNDSIWKNTKNAMETYNFGGKHFMFVTDVKAEYFVYYNTATIKECGLKDPWKLYENGEWNWNTFKSMLKKYVNEDEDRYGLDGWYNENALMYSAGMPAVKNVKGHVVSKLNSSTVKKAMDYQYGLYKDGLVLDKDQFGWTEHPQMMGIGCQLFRIGGYWEVYCAPELWVNDIPPENLGIVPVPSPKGSKSYQAANLEGYVLCKGATNPKGAALLAECGIVAAYDKDIRKLERQQNIDNYGWTTKIANRIDKINALARKYPVIELANSCSKDIESYMISGEYGMRAAFYGVKWSDTQESIAGAFEMLVKEADDNLQSKVKEYK